MLMNVLSRLVGAKSLELKVDNMEAYNFQPKNLLREVCLAVLNFADFDKFSYTISMDGFCEEGVPLLKAVNTVSKLGLVSGMQRDVLAALAERVVLECNKNKDIEALIADAPEGLTAVTQIHNLLPYILYPTLHYQSYPYLAYIHTFMHTKV